MIAEDLKKRIDAICKTQPKLNMFIRVNRGDGAYNVCDIETVENSIFNGLFLMNPEVHTDPNCAVITVSEIPSDEHIAIS
jgi:hypothetical protein